MMSLLNEVIAKYVKRNVSGTLAFADNPSQKQLCTAALKQSFSLCKGYQKPQLRQAGQAHSLCCKVRGAPRAEVSPLCQEPYATGREMWTFPKAAADKVCSGRSGEACWNCLEAWIMLWGTFRTLCCQENPALWRGLGARSTHAFSVLTISFREQLYPQSTSAAGKEHLLPFTAGECGQKSLIDFSKVTEPDGSSRILVWSADQSLNKTKQSSLQLQGHNVCGLVFSEGIIWAHVRMCKTGRNLLFDLHKKP